MKSITSKLSIIILSLAAMAFTFVLGTTSSKAVSDEAAFAQCVADIGYGDLDPNADGLNTIGVSFTAMLNRQAILSIMDCAR